MQVTSGDTSNFQKTIQSKDFIIYSANCCLGAKTNQHVGILLELGMVPITYNATKASVKIGIELKTKIEQPS